MLIRRLVAGVHGLLAVLHVYWATGATWPASDGRSLSYAVLGGPASFSPVVVLPLAVLHILLAVAILTSERYKLSRLVVAGLAAGLAARATAGLVWIAGAGHTTTTFYWLNLLLYTPLCIALCVADLSMLRARWIKATAVAVPVVGVVLLSLVAYAYQPTEQPEAAPSPDSRYVETPLAASITYNAGPAHPSYYCRPAPHPHPPGIPNWTPSPRTTPSTWSTCPVRARPGCTTSTSLSTSTA